MNCNTTKKQRSSTATTTTTTTSAPMSSTWRQLMVVAMMLLCGSSCHVVSAYMISFPSAFRTGPSASSWRQDNQNVMTDASSSSSSPLISQVQQASVAQQKKATGGATAFVAREEHVPPSYFGSGSALAVGRDAGPPSRRRRGSSWFSSLRNRFRLDASQDADVDVVGLLAETEAAIQAADDIMKQRPNVLTKRQQRATLSVIQGSSIDGGDNMRNKALRLEQQRKADQLVLSSTIGASMLGCIIGATLPLQYPGIDLMVDTEVLPPAMGVFLGATVYLASTSLDGMPRNLVLAMFGLPTQALGGALKESIRNGATELASSAKASVENGAAELAMTAQQRLEDAIQEFQQFPSKAVDAAQESTKSFVQAKKREIQSIPAFVAQSARRQLTNTTKSVAQLPRKTTELAKDWFLMVVGGVQQAPGRLLMSTRRQIRRIMGLSREDREYIAEKIAQAPNPPKTKPPMSLLKEFLRDKRGSSRSEERWMNE